MIDRYPTFLPRWTNALIHIHNDRVLRHWRKTQNSNDVIRKAIDKFGLNWDSGSCCLTGEAFFNHYAPTHGCHTCYTLTNITSRECLRSLDELYEFKIVLANHLKTNHPDIWDQWKDKL